MEMLVHAPQRKLLAIDLNVSVGLFALNVYEKNDIGFHYDILSQRVSIIVKNKRALLKTRL